MVEGHCHVSGLCHRRRPGDIVSNAEKPGPVHEAYFRRAKALVGFGSAKGEDHAYGSRYEWVALDNPYTTPTGPLHFSLLFDGNPAALQPVDVFVRGLTGSAEVQPQRFMIDSEGVLTLPEDLTGEVMLNSVKLLPAPAGSGMDWVSHWASLTFAR